MKNDYITWIFKTRERIWMIKKQKISYPRFAWFWSIKCFNTKKKSLETFREISSIELYSVYLRIVLIIYLWTILNYTKPKWNSFYHYNFGISTFHCPATKVGHGWIICFHKKSTEINYEIFLFPILQKSFVLSDRVLEKRVSNFIIGINKKATHAEFFFIESLS